MRASFHLVPLLAALIAAASCTPRDGAAPPPPSGGGPVALAALPDDGAGMLFDALAGARSRIDVEMYMFTDDGAFAALAAARARGVDVRVILEQAPFEAPDANAATFAALGAAGVDVRWAPQSVGLLHAKLVVADDAALVMTANLTRAGLGSNREYIVADRDPGDVAAARAVIDADALGAAPAARPGGARLLLSPVDARPRIAALIDGAGATLAIEMEELSDGDLAGRLVSAQARGVTVTIVVPAANRSAATNTTLAALAAAGVTVKTLGAPSIHAKAIVADAARPAGASVYVGSVNLTRASLDANREVGLVLTDAPTIARLSATIAADATRAASFAASGG